jgi:hypothetical protein
MWFLAGAVLGTIATAVLMKHWFDCGWLRSAWYDKQVDDLVERARRGKPIAREWR